MDCRGLAFGRGDDGKLYPFVKRSGEIAGFFKKMGGGTAARARIPGCTGGEGSC